MVRSAVCVVIVVVIVVVVAPDVVVIDLPLSLVPHRRVKPCCVLLCIVVCRVVDVVEHECGMRWEEWMFLTVRVCGLCVERSAACENPGNWEDWGIYNDDVVVYPGLARSRGHFFYFFPPKWNTVGAEK